MAFALHRMIQAIMSGHVSCITDPNNPENSIRIAIECGVLQGGILSPFFFSIFADSLFDHPSFQSLQALYADDRTIMDEDPTRLQESLSALESWASSRNLIHDGNELLVVNALQRIPSVSMGLPSLASKQSNALGS